MPRREFPLLHLVPTELRDVLLDFVWDADRLRELDLTTKTMPVSELDWHLDLPFWSVDDVPFQVKPGRSPPNQADSQRSTSALSPQISGSSWTCSSGPTG